MREVCGHPQSVLDLLLVAPDMVESALFGAMLEHQI